MVDRKSQRSEDIRDRNPGAAEQAGEGVGGIGGTLAGAGIGSIAGPVGTIIGGLAGAVGGWWAGEKAGRAIEDIGDSDEDFRRHHREAGSRDLEYDEARIGYGIGHIASRNPDYKGRAFSDVDADLRRGWRYENRDYDAMRPYVQYGYEKSSRSRRD